MVTSNFEPFVHGRLVKQLDPQYVLSRADADYIAYPFNKAEHYLCDIRSDSGQMVAHDLLLSLHRSIGALWTHDKAVDDYRIKARTEIFPEPVVVNESMLRRLRQLNYPGSKDELDEVLKTWGKDGFDTEILGRVSNLNRDWAYLIERNGRIKAHFRLYNDDPLLTKGDFPVDLDAHAVVGEFLADRFYYTIMPNVKYPIRVYDSVTSQLAQTKLSMSKEMLLRSPLLKQGVTFSMGNDEQGYATVTVWIENAPLDLDEQTIYMWVENGIGDYEREIDLASSVDDQYGDFFFFFDVSEMPDKLNEKTIARFFKQMQFKNKDREARHRAWVCEKFGFFNEDNSPYGDPTELRYQVQLAFINYAVMARNYTQIEARGNADFDTHAVKVEREGSQELFSQVLKMLCAMWDPKLKGELKRVKPQRTRQAKKKSQKQIKAPRQWTWGDDRIRYIAPCGEGDKITTRFYTRPSMATRYVNDLEKYGGTDGFYELVEPINGRTHAAFVYVKGHWKGEGEDGELPEYFVGKPPAQQSRMAIAWLKRVAKEEGVHIQHADNGGEVCILDTPYRVDGYCEETNTIYEFHGDYWHGNPAVYDRDVLRNGKTMGEYYDNTIERENVLRSMGYNLVVMWESEWREIV